MKRKDMEIQCTGLLNEGIAFQMDVSVIFFSLFCIPGRNVSRQRHPQTIPNPNGWGAKLFGRRWINWHIPYHLQHFSKKSVQLSAEKSGFDIQTIKTVTTSEWLHYQWMSLIAYPNLGEKSVFWDGNARNVGKLTIKYAGFAFFTLLHKIKVNHVVTRLFDSIGLGDSYIILLKKKK